ncbi:MAG: serine/threonine protein kinase [Planctomycetaceae bacterium]|nr:serine/threonine protein kinase [Planctomycetaceae bacterium]
MLRLCLGCLALILSAPALGVELDAELDYAIDQPLMTIRDAETRAESDEVHSLAQGRVVHIDWDDGERLLTTIDGQRVTISRADLRPLAQAVESFTQQLAAGPARRSLYLYRSQANRLLGRQQQALADIEAAEALVPRHPETAVYRGGQFHEIHDINAAWREAEWLQMRHPFYVEGYLLSVAVAMEFEDDETAGGYLAIALELDPDHKFVQSYLATFLSNAAQTSEQWQVVVRILDELLRLDPYDSHSLEIRRDAHHELGNAVESHQDLIACRALYSSWQKGCPENPRYWLQRGLLYFELKNWGAAEKDLSEAIRLDPNDFDSRQFRYCARARQDDSLNDSLSLLEDVNRIVELRPWCSKYRFERAKTLFALNRYADSRAEADQALRLDPENLQVRFLRATAAVKCQDWLAADSDLRFLMADTSPKQFTNTDLASIYLALGDDARALSLLSSETNKTQTTENCFFHLACRAACRGDLETSQSLLSQSSSRAREYQLKMSVCRYLAGDAATAEEVLYALEAASLKRGGTGTAISVTAKGVQSIRTSLKSSPSPLPDPPIDKLLSEALTQDTASGNKNGFGLTAESAHFFRTLFKIQNRQLEPDIDFIKTLPSASMRDYILARIFGVDQSPDFRDGPQAVTTGEELLKRSTIPATMRIPIYEAIAAGYAESGQFKDAVRWQRRILDEVPRDHPRRAWYWDVHRRYLKNEKHPLGQSDPDLVLPAVRNLFELEDAPGLLSPLPPPLPE